MADKVQGYEFIANETKFTVLTRYFKTNNENKEVKTLDIIEHGEVPKIMELGSQGFTELQNILNDIKPPKEILANEDKKKMLDLIEKLGDFVEGFDTSILPTEAVLKINELREAVYQFWGE